MNLAQRWHLSFTQHAAAASRELKLVNDVQQHVLTKLRPQSTRLQGLLYLADDALGGLVDCQLRTLVGLGLLGLVARPGGGRLLSISSSHGDVLCSVACVLENHGGHGGRSKARTGGERG